MVKNNIYHQYQCPVKTTRSTDDKDPQKVRLMFTLVSIFISLVVGIIISMIIFISSHTVHCPLFELIKGYKESPLNQDEWNQTKKCSTKLDPDKLSMETKSRIDKSFSLLSIWSLINYWRSWFWFYQSRPV